MASSIKKPYPRYYTVNDRPVKIVEDASGGLTTLVFEWSSGAFVRDQTYFMQIMTPGKDVDTFTKNEFEEKVQALRIPVAARLASMPITWEHTGDGEIPYVTRMGGHQFTVRINDFPAEPLYSLLVDGEKIIDLDDWPAAWVMPAEPQELLDKVHRVLSKNGQ